MWAKKNFDPETAQPHRLSDPLFLQVVVLTIRLTFAISHDGHLWQQRQGYFY